MPIYRKVKIAGDPTIPEFGLPAPEGARTIPEEAIVSSVKEQLGWTDDEE
ncbi:MAG TPA: hypothetical protein VLH08_17015 [Acidobacteriota bacterium]|nr:hypothetical protein [Acidobacteriota bacterium]